MDSNFNTEYGVTISFVVTADNQSEAEKSAREYANVLENAGAEGVFIEDVCKPS